MWNGKTLGITNATEADMFLVFATVDPSLGYKGITCFVVEKEFEGFSIAKKENKMGIRASSTCVLHLDGCRVPKENVIGDVGKGYKLAIETLNEGRIGIGGQMLGLARGAIDHTIAYTKERKQFGQSLADFQGVQFAIAEIETQIEAARCLVYNTARLKDNKLPFIKEAAMAKYFSSNVAERAASKAIELFGGYGYTKEYPVEKLFRDVKIGQIYEGTNHMQLLTIAKHVLGSSSK